MRSSCLGGETSGRTFTTSERTFREPLTPPETFWNLLDPLTHLQSPAHRDVEETKTEEKQKRSVSVQEDQVEPITAIESVSTCSITKT